MIFPRINTKRTNRRVYTNRCCPRYVVCSVHVDFHWDRIIPTYRHMCINSNMPNGDNKCVYPYSPNGWLFGFVVFSIIRQQICWYHCVCLCLCCYYYCFDYFSSSYRIMMFVGFSFRFHQKLPPYYVLHGLLAFNLSATCLRIPHCEILASHKRMLVVIISIPLMIVKLFFTPYYHYYVYWEAETSTDNMLAARVLLRRLHIIIFQLLHPTCAEDEGSRELWMAASDHDGMKSYSHCVFAIGYPFASFFDSYFLLFGVFCWNVSSFYLYSLLILCLEVL